MLISPRMWLAVTLMMSGLIIMGPVILLLMLFFVGLAAV
tara:strand:+ start:290 stop:406 length:117 start_codon:yes stop_codon:yes gene_type:complete